MSVFAFILRSINLLLIFSCSQIIIKRLSAGNWQWKWFRDFFHIYFFSISTFAIVYIVFKYFDKQCLHYLNEIFLKTIASSLSLKNSYHKLNRALCRTSIDHIALSFVGPSLGNKIPEELKRTTSLNTPKYSLEGNWDVIILRNILVIVIIIFSIFNIVYFNIIYYLCHHYYHCY